ncbi:MAG TPA: (Fe-S)-binding protein [Gaiellales bacterium]|jgi:glycolate oxidase iron-sulfur subunit|nr:(Fe-S)-binding protein [Gaiellales bacterium]
MTGVELSEARRGRFDELARQCVSCGLCLPHCPTYDLLAAESDGPRGRIHIMQRLVAGDLSVEEAREPLDRCLGCRACETACPSGVQYGQLLEIARDGGAQTPSLQIRTLLSFVRRPRLLALAMRAGRPLAGLMPGTAGRSGKSLDRHGSVTWERRNAGGPPAVVLRGCVMREAFAGVQQAAVDSLAEAGYDVMAGPEQGCCGALHLHNGELTAGESMREALLGGLPAGAILVSTAAGCGAALRESDERVLDLSEALVQAPSPPRGAGGGPVAVFDACHLLHAQGVREAPRELLRAAGYEPVELDGNGRCCGAAGVYSFTQPELSQQLAASRVEAIRASGAQVVSCGNPGCALQLRTALREAHLDARVAHPAELVAEATAQPR